jgi:hypothetical protein
VLVSSAGKVMDKSQEEIEGEKGGDILKKATILVD